MTSLNINKLSLTSDFLLEYIFEPIRTDNFSSVILNPNFIYKLIGGVYYIPIEIPFDSLTSHLTINNMKGIYIYPNRLKLLGHHTFTNKGFNLLSSDRAIVGIAPFPTPMKFMNWPNKTIEGL